MKYNVLAIIPARGGSKGLKQKNILPLLDKPLIIWTIEQAKNSKLIDEIFVSTDDPEIESVCKKHGFILPHLRPPELAGDKSPTIEAIIHTLDYYKKINKTFDIIILLEPTSPLRCDCDIDTAIDVFIKNYSDYDSLVSLGEVHLEHPMIIKSIQDGFVIPYVQEKTNNYYQRQQLPVAYFPYGVIYLSKVETLLLNKTFYQKRTMPYFIKRWQNYEIDDIWDFICVESILRRKQLEL